ncbi:hypothetical protein Agub_g9319, partial [Astrephomene gubernaculifera]
MAACGLYRTRTSSAYVGRLWQRAFASASGAAGAGQPQDEDGARKRIIFLGTPQVAALVLEQLLSAAAAPGSNFEVAAVVTRPSGRPAGPSSPSAQAALAPGDTPHHQQLQGATAGLPPPPSPSSPSSSSRRKAVEPSAVEQLARQCGLPPDRILCPASAREPAFLDAVRHLRPSLAITAAYGCMLPQSFLDIPRYGTLNIHPSLLPRYRGPAPVQRALQDGCSATGVSLVFSVLRCDAGPLLEQQQVAVPPDVQAPQLTEQLFRRGAEMLLRQLPRVLSGEVGAAQAAPQDEAAATYAPKVVKQEAQLDLSLPALAVHNHVRALADWPGSRCTLMLEARETGALQPLEVRLLRTRVVPPPLQASWTPRGALPPGTRAQVLVSPAGELLVPCGDGNMLQVLEVGRKAGGVGAPSSSSSSPRPSAKSLTPREFIAGLSKRRVFVP